MFSSLGREAASHNAENDEVGDASLGRSSPVAEGEPDRRPLCRPLLRPVESLLEKVQLKFDTPDGVQPNVSKTSVDILCRLMYHGMCCRHSFLLFAKTLIIFTRMASTWYYYDHNGQKQGPITSGQLKELANQGTVTPETIIENEEGKSAFAKDVKGLTFVEATPSELPQYTAAPLAEQNPFADESHNPFQSFDGNYVSVSEPIMRGYRDPGVISFITIFFIVLALILNAVSILGNIMERNMLLNIQSGAYETEEEMMAAANTSDTIQGIIGAVFAIVYLVAGILFLIWTYRIVKNAHCLTYRPLRFGPGWAVGYYFIPILCLFRPFQALSDAHRVSKNPSDWAATSGSALLGWWWASFIVSNIAGNIGFRLTMATRNAAEELLIDALLTSNMCDTIVNLTVNPLNNLLALLVVWKLYSSQQEAHQQVVHSPPPPVDSNMYAQQLPEDTWLIPSQRISVWAIAAGYVGMFAVLFFPAPIALILGIIALRDCNKRSVEGKGRAIFAIVMGVLFTILLLLILAALLITVA